MRGEDRTANLPAVGWWGSPPHARGRPGRAPLPRPALDAASPGPLPDHPRMRGEDGGVNLKTFETDGSPPHARGRREQAKDEARRKRITPACAGKTLWLRRGRRCFWDHPRMRGEDMVKEDPRYKKRGSPPHARGRPAHSRAALEHSRITPACAGKTATSAFVSSCEADHPRMRGEDAIRVLAEIAEAGITPACAGKTVICFLSRIGRRDHPRMRGEDANSGRPSLSFAGSPPHARGRRSGRGCVRVFEGITPACAGKTAEILGIAQTNVDHPRMRGEDTYVASPWCLGEGSPPHARGRHPIVAATIVALGITPACAGKTRRNGTRHRGIRDHPRMRGEDKLNALGLPRRTGSPPHARGRLENDAGRAAAGGITPACAGKTWAGPAGGARVGDHPRMRGEDVLILFRRNTQHGSPPHARGRQLDSPGNTAKSFPSLPVFFCSQPSPLGWFLRWVLGLGSSLWKQR